MTTPSVIASATTTYGPIGAIGTVGTSTAGTSNSSSPTSATDPNTIDKDMFLKLLVAQMKYQDPNNATDPSTFISQTAQFTTVEKLNALEALSQKVYDSGRQQNATTMLGRTVTFTDAAGATQTGIVTGVSVGASTPNLTVGGIQVPLDSVTTVASVTPPASG